jgi:hypothetical protein
MGEFKVYTALEMQVIYNIKISIRSCRNKSNKNHYPSDDPEIVAGDSATPVQEKLAYCVVIMAGLKSARKKKFTYHKQTAMHRQGITC